jgi:hypothetical protein
MTETTKSKSLARLQALEAVAEAARADMGEWTGTTRQKLEIALAGLDAAGYAVVPVEPSEAMAHAGGCASEPGVRMEGPMPSSKHKAKTIYRAMLAAAGETGA